MKNNVAELRTKNSWSQAQLAAILSISRQTVIQLEQARTDPSLSLAMRIAWLFQQPVESIFYADLEEQLTALNEAWEYQKKGATAFNEVGILDRMGVEGWELTSFGVGSLQFRRPQSEWLRRVWLYQRLDGVMSGEQRQVHEAQGWTFCGSWMGVFHYFKREERKLERGSAAA